MFLFLEKVTCPLNFLDPPLLYLFLHKHSILLIEKFFTVCLMCVSYLQSLNQTIPLYNKIITCNASVIKVFITWKESSFQDLFIDIDWVFFVVTKKLIPFVFGILLFEIFVVQYMIEWFDIEVSITPDCKKFFCVFVKIWSLRVEVLQGTLVGQFINWWGPYSEQISFYFFILSFLVLFVFLNKHCPYLSFKSPRI